MKDVWTRRPLFLLVLFFILSRLFFLLSFDLSEEVKFGFEPLQGLISYELINGLHLPLLDYRGSTYMGGAEMVIGFWTVPFFLLLGPNLFALRLASVAWSLLIFLLIYFFLKRHFSREQAKWASVYFIFAPPSLILISLMALGYHFQSLLFVLGFLWPFYEQHFKSLDKNWAFLFQGLVLGLGVFFNLQVLIALVGFFLFTWIYDRRSLFCPSILLFFLGFLVGYAPGLYDNFTNQLGAFFVYDKPFYEHFLQLGFWEKLILTLKRAILFLVLYIPHDLRFEKSGWLGPFLSWGYYLAVVFSVGVLAKKAAAQIKLLLFYLGLASLIYLFSDFGLSAYRYLSPFFVFFCILLGLHFGAPAKTAWKGWALLRVLPLLICVAGWIPFLTTPQIAEGFQKRGYSYSALLTALNWTRKVFGISIQKENLQRLVKTAHESLDAHFIPVFEQILGLVVFYGSLEEDLAKNVALIKEAEGDLRHRANFYHQLGYNVACHDKKRPDTKAFLVRAAKLPWGLRGALAEGAGECVFTEKLSLQPDPPASLRNDFYRGIGEAFGTIFEEDFGGGVQKILELPEELRPILFEGFGKGIYWWNGGRVEMSHSLMEKVPGEYQFFFQQGLTRSEYKE